MNQDSRQSRSGELTPEEAHRAILDGFTVRMVVGPGPEDPVLLHYLDRCWEFDHQPMIYTEAIGGWSEGIKEAICEPLSDFYAGEFARDPKPHSLTIADEEPLLRESEEPVHYA